MPSLSPAVTATQTFGPSQPPPDKAAARNASFGFDDILDIINPLQHIPVVSTLYRKFTGDTMSPTAEIFGGALFGGVVGAVSSVADVLWTQATGKDMGNTVYAWLGLEGKDKAFQFAKADPPAAAAKPLPLAIQDVPVTTEALPPVAALPVAPDALPQIAQALPAATRAGQPAAAPLPAPNESTAPGAAPVNDSVPGLYALMQAMQKQGISPEVQARAAAAYRRAIGVGQDSNPAAAPAL